MGQQAHLAIYSDIPLIPDAYWPSLQQGSCKDRPPLKQWYPSHIASRSSAIHRGPRKPSRTSPCWLLKSYFRKPRWDQVIFPYRALPCLMLRVMYPWGCAISSKVVQDAHSKPASAGQGSQAPELSQQQRLIFSDQTQCRLFPCLECGSCLIRTLNRNIDIALAVSCSFVMLCKSYALTEILTVC